MPLHTNKVRAVPDMGQWHTFLEDPNGMSVDFPFAVAEATTGPAAVFRP